MVGLSIVITYYNGEKFIENCINSLIISHNKSIEKIPFEIILIIDSPLNSSTIIQKLNSKFKDLIDLNIQINENNQGVSKSRNIGLSLTKYRYYTIIDQDDNVLDNYFSIIIDNIDNKYPVLLLNGYINNENLKQKNTMYLFKPKFKFSNILLQNTIIYTPGLLIFDSHEIVKENFFIETSTLYKGCDDWAGYLNLLSKKKIKYFFVKTPVFSYNIHSENFSNQLSTMLKSAISVLKYLENKPFTNKYNKQLIKFSIKLQEFYLSKNCLFLSKIKLTSKYPIQVFYHYFGCYLNLDRFNNLIIKINSKLK